MKIIELMMSLIIQGKYSNPKQNSPNENCNFAKFACRYDSRTLKNDIAIIRLSRRVTFTSRIRNACLPDRFKGFDLTNLRIKPTIIGWGSTDDDR